MADNWKVYYLFLDGVGFGSTKDINPFYTQKTEIFHHLAQDTAYLSLWAQKEAGIEPASNVYLHRESGLAVKSIDPSSGVKGLPQSGSGQTSLFTGVDGPLVLDRHVPNFPSFTLKKFIKKYSLFKLLADGGVNATLLNSYSPYYLDVVLPKGKFISASTLTQLAADQELKTFHNLIRDESLYMDITYRFLIENHRNGDSRMLSGDWSGIDEAKLLNVQEPASRGRRFIEIAREFDYDVVLFEYFFSDKAGHDQDPVKCAEIIEILDEFIQSAAASLGPRETLIISSDHGNMEDLSTKSHTHNSVPLYVFGDDPDFFLDRVTRLAHIPRAILERFGLEHEFLGDAHAEEL